MPINQHGFTECEWQALQSRFGRIDDGFMYHLDKIGDVLDGLDVDNEIENYGTAARKLGEKLIDLVSGGNNPLPLSLPEQQPYPRVTGSRLCVQLLANQTELKNVINLKTKKILYNKLPEPDFPEWVEFGQQDN